MNVHGKRKFEVRGLQVGLLGRKVLDGFSFVAEGGKPTLLFGPNGAGKSTALHALAGFFPTCGGTTRLDGVD